MALAETAELAVRISLKDNVSAGVRGLQKNLGGLNRSLAQTGRGVGQIGAGLTRAGLVVGGAAVAGLVAAAKAGADFEAQLNTINTIARKTPDELAAIGNGIRDLARQGRGDLTDLTAGFYDILSAGITDTAEAQKVLTSASTLAIGSLSTNAEAVDLLTTAINAYGQDASAAQADADLFAKAVEIGKVKADQIAASFAQVAPIAAQVGINIEEVAAAYGALTAQGTPAAEVATQMQRSIIELLNPTADLINLQEKLGVSFLQIAKDKGLVVALQAMRDGVGDNDEAFKALFGRVEAYKFALQTTGPQNKIYNDALKAMGESAGTASEQMGERTKGLAFQVQRLKNNLVDAGITLSDGFLPPLTRSIDKLSQFLALDNTKTRLKEIGEDIGKSIDSIDWNAVLTAADQFVGILKGALTFAKLMYDAFSALPGPIKEATAGFLVLNKLSGGLLAAGAGNVIGGLAGAAIQGTAARAPGVGSLFAQPVFVTNWAMIAGGNALGGAGAAGAAGLAGKIASLIPATLFATALISAAVPIGEAFAAALPKELKGANGAGMSESQTRILAARAAMGIVPDVVPATGADRSLIATRPIRPGVVDSNRASPASIEMIEAAIKAGRAAGFSPSWASGVETVQKNASRAAERQEAAASSLISSALIQQRAGERLSAVTIPPPNVNVVVNVSPTGLVNKYISLTRPGPAGSSRETSKRFET